MSNEAMQNIGDALIEQCPDAIIFSDITGIIRTWNSAAVKIFGFTKEQAIGANLDIIVPESYRKAHWLGFERAIAEAKTKYVGQSLPTKSLKADGSSIYVELSFSIVLDSDDVVLGALSSARDITERFKKEREDRRRLKELESAGRQV